MTTIFDVIECRNLNDTRVKGEVVPDNDMAGYPAIRPIVLPRAGYPAKK